MNLHEHGEIHRETGWVKYATPVSITRMIGPRLQEYALQVVGPAMPYQLVDGARECLGACERGGVDSGEGLGGDAGL